MEHITKSTKTETSLPELLKTIMKLLLTTTMLMLMMSILLSIPIVIHVKEIGTYKSMNNKMKTSKEHQQRQWIMSRRHSKAPT